MRTQKNSEAMSLTVTEGLTVTILPNSNHEFLMTTKEVANGYGVTEYNIRLHKMQHSDELKEGKHFVTAVSIPNSEFKSLKIPHNAVLWTKAGIVRLGFFIKSERAKLFRDWAESLILNVLDNKPLLPEPKRRHNRLTPERLLDVMADVCLIENTELRTRIANKLMGKGVQHGNL